MFDTLPAPVVDFLDGALEWVYSFQPIIEPTVVLGKSSGSFRGQCDNVFVPLVHATWRDPEQI